MVLRGVEGVRDTPTENIPALTSLAARIGSHVSNLPIYSDHTRQRQSLERLYESEPAQRSDSMGVEKKLNGLEAGNEIESMSIKDVALDYIKSDPKAIDFINRLGINIESLDPQEWKISGAGDFFNCMLVKNDNTILRLHFYPQGVNDVEPHCHATDIKSYVMHGSLNHEVFSYDENMPGDMYKVQYDENGNSSLVKFGEGGVVPYSSEKISSREYKLPAGYFHTVGTPEKGVTVTLCAFDGPKKAASTVITEPGKPIQTEKKRTLKQQSQVMLTYFLKELGKRKTFG